MATKIRMTRGGRKNQPFYHIIVADSRSPRDGRFIEKLGYWNPLTKELKWNEERVNYWVGTGAEPTDTIASMIVKNNLGTAAFRAKFEKLTARRTEIVRKKKEAEAAAKAAAEAAAE